MLTEIRQLHTLTSIELLAGLMKTKESKKPDFRLAAKIFKALSNENRIELFYEILKMREASFETAEKTCFVTDLMDSMNIGAPTISHHIKELSSAGLIVTERKGKFLTAKINEETLQTALSFLKGKPS